ncbi:MAG: putative Zn-dependent protease [Myxococcota bacterium]|jgi:predicted Zn-dependent protease
MQAMFGALAAHLDQALGAGEQYTAYFSGERSAFVRFNHGRVRQPGDVVQASLAVRLVRDGRQARAVVPISGEPSADRAEIDGALAHLRQLLPHLPRDPHLSLYTSSEVSHDEVLGDLPPASDVLDVLLDAAAGTDLVGLLTSGPVFRGFASSSGQRDWFGRAALHVDWSLVLADDKAVKDTLATAVFDEAALRARIDAGRQALADLARPVVRKAPGAYRAWLTPGAAGELLDMMSWDAFSARELDARNSPLSRLRAREVTLDPRVGLTEAIEARGLPRFGADGFPKPAAVPLIERGEMCGALVSPRSAKELSLTTTGAGSAENASALSMSAGELATPDARRELGTGVWVSNLWYANWSDRTTARVTGMTRFATFWVEDGEVVGPLQAMRFDDSVYRMLGSGLLGLGDTVEDLPDVSSYGGRSLGGMASPGWLVDDFRLTL